MHINLLAAAFAAAGIVFSSSAFDWSENGHQTAQAIADSLPHGTPVEAQFQAILARGSHSCFKQFCPTKRAPITTS